MANIRWLSPGNAKYIGRAVAGERICTWGIPAWITPHGVKRLGKIPKPGQPDLRIKYVFKKKDVRLICFGAAFKQLPAELAKVKDKEGAKARTLMRKMKGVSQIGYSVNPGRGCIDGCFARVGQYAAPSVQVGHMKRYALTKDSARFITEMTHEIKTGRVPATKIGDLILPAQDKVTMVRIHDSGDFWGPQYLEAWLKIIEACPEVFFFTYTKSFTLFKNLDGSWRPEMLERVNRLEALNFALAFSEGSKWDHLINPAEDRHSRIFRSIEELLSAGYTDCSRDDAYAFEKRHRKIGLVFHGNGTPFTTDPRVTDPFAPFTQQTHRALVKMAEERDQS